MKRIERDLRDIIEYLATLYDRENSDDPIVEGYKLYHLPPKTFPADGAWRVALVPVSPSEIEITEFVSWKTKVDICKQTTIDETLISIEDAYRILSEFFVISFAGQTDKKRRKEVREELNDKGPNSFFSTVTYYPEINEFHDPSTGIVANSFEGLQELIVEKKKN